VPFAAAARFAAFEVVHAGAGMRIDHPERRRLCAQIIQNAAKHRMFEHVGETSGVKSVTVVHGACSKNSHSQH
jgi:hypothetical protein